MNRSVRPKRCGPSLGLWPARQSPTMEKGDKRGRMRDLDRRRPAHNVKKPDNMVYSRKPKQPKLTTKPMPETAGNVA